MRQLWTIAAAASLLPLAACGMMGGETETTQAAAPTVSYQFNTEEEFAEIRETAQGYCDDEFGNDAMLVSRQAQDGYTEATFSCR